MRACKGFVGLWKGFLEWKKVYDYDDYYYYYYK